MRQCFVKHVVLCFALLISVQLHATENWTPDSITQEFASNLNQVQNIASYNKNGVDLKVVTFSSHEAIFQAIFLNENFLEFSGLETNGYFIDYQYEYNDFNIVTIIENGKQIDQVVSVKTDIVDLLENSEAIPNIQFGNEYRFSSPSEARILYHNWGGFSDWAGYTIMVDSNFFDFPFHLNQYHVSFNVRPVTKMRAGDLAGGLFRYPSTEALIDTTEIINGVLLPNMT